MASVVSAVNGNSTGNSLDVSSNITNWTHSSTARISTSASHGGASISGQWVNVDNDDDDYSVIIKYSPAKSYYGLDTFKYSVSNEGGASSQCNCNVTIIPPPPTCKDTPTIKVAQNSSNNGIALGQYITGWYTGTINGVAPSISISGPSHGTTTLSNESLQYTPTKDYYGTDSLQYTVTNSSGTSTSCNCNISIAQAKPTCTRFTTTVDSSSANNSFDVSGSISGWAANSTTKIIGGPSHGSASINGASISYSPVPNYGTQNITDSIQYSVSNPVGTTTCSCVITLKPTPPKPPTCSDFTINVQNGTNANENIYTDHIAFPNAQSSNIVITQQPEHGHAGGSSNGIFSVSYPPNPFVGTDSVPFHISNSTGDSSTCNCTVNVTEGKPLCGGSPQHSTYNGVPCTIDLTKWIVNWNSNKTAKVSRAPKHGSATNNGLVFVYTPSGVTTRLTDTFDYTISNDIGSCTSTIAIDVIPIPTPVRGVTTIAVSLGNSKTTPYWQDIGASSYFNYFIQTNEPTPDVLPWGTQQIPSLDIVGGPYGGQAEIGNSMHNESIYPCNKYQCGLIWYLPRLDTTTDSISVTATNGAGTSVKITFNITIGR